MGVFMSSQTLDAANAEFWTEPCGSTAARRLGVTDASRESLARFDAWYFATYPYLGDYIPFAEMRGRAVLEVGLGYGTLSQRMAEAGSLYTGLDIADGPVRLVNHRLRQNGLRGQAIKGSILAPPFPDRTFDYVVAIGCLHHTGDMQTAIDTCRRLLVPRGELIFMVYNACSYRRWLMAPLSTLRYRVREAAGLRGAVGAERAAQRRSYDANLAGEAAPHTDFVSIRSLAAMCSAFASFRASIENVGDPSAYCRFLPSRSRLLSTRFAHRLGVDIYARATVA